MRNLWAIAIILMVSALWVFLFYHNWYPTIVCAIVVLLMWNHSNRAYKGD